MPTPEQIRLFLGRAALVSIVVGGMLFPWERWRAQPAFDPDDPDTWVGPYRRALGDVSPNFAPVVWRPPARTGQSGPDSLLWAPVLLQPLLSFSLGGPASFVGVCDRTPHGPSQDSGYRYDAELEAPVAHPPAAALRTPPLPPDAGPVEMTFAIRFRYSSADGRCDAASDLEQPIRIAFRAWRNPEGRWRVQTYGATTPWDIADSVLTPPEAQQRGAAAPAVRGASPASP